MLKAHAQRIREAISHKVTTYETAGEYLLRVHNADYYDHHTDVTYPGDVELVIMRRDEGWWDWSIEHLSRDGRVLEDGAARTLADAVSAGVGAMRAAVMPMTNTHDVRTAWLRA